MRDLARTRALRGLGAMNLCEDPGWNFVQALTGAAGSIVGAFSSGTTTYDAMGKPVTSGGSTAGAATGAGLTATASAWQAACASQSARNNDAATASNTAQLQALLDAQAARNEQAVWEARRSSEQALQAMLLAQQQGQRAPQELIAGVPNQTLILGGLAVAGVIGLALLVKRRK